MGVLSIESTTNIGVLTVLVVIVVLLSDNDDDIVCKNTITKTTTSTGCHNSFIYSNSTYGSERK
jgi:hypothetical protein